MKKMSLQYLLSVLSNEAVVSILAKGGMAIRGTVSALKGMLSMHVLEMTIQYIGVLDCGGTCICIEEKENEDG